MTRLIMMITCSHYDDSDDDDDDFCQVFSHSGHSAYRQFEMWPEKQHGVHVAFACFLHISAT